MLTSVSLFASANAGELTVTGTAKATINSVTGSANGGKGLGVTNEFNLGANGELDNGYTWNYKVAMDPGAAGAQFNDDTTLSVTAPFGTVGIFISAGGLDLEDGASQSVYGRPTDIGDPSATTDNLTTDGDNTIQYHTPSGLLPYGITGKFSYAPSASDTQGAAANATAALEGTGGLKTRTGVQIKAAPIDGLTVGASYLEKDHNINTVQKYETGGVFATYAYGPVSIGYGENRTAPNSSSFGTVATTTVATEANTKRFDNQLISLGFAVNENLSVSYDVEKSEAAKFTNLETAAGDTKNAVELQIKSLQAAYNIGGATIAITMEDIENDGYVLSKNNKETIISLAMAF